MTKAINVRGDMTHVRRKFTSYLYDDQQLEVSHIQRLTSFAVSSISNRRKQIDVQAKVCSMYGV